MHRLAGTCLYVLPLAASAALAQTGTAGIAGTILDAKTSKPVPTALVIANRAGAPPLARDTRTGGDGAFQIPGLPAGKYALCVQVSGDRYLDPCQWNGSAITLTLASGQSITGVSLRLVAASVVNIQVEDPQQVLSQKTKDGRQPELNLGVWGPKGIYYPAHRAGKQATAASYRLAVPLDTALNFFAASRDLKLGDVTGVPLPGNASQQAFQHATGDANPKSFAFTVLGMLP